MSRASEPEKLLGDNLWVINTRDGAIEVWCGDPQLDYPEKLTPTQARSMAMELIKQANAMEAGQ